MHIHVIPTPFYGANCLVMVPDAGHGALVVDPSAGVRDRIRAVLEDEGTTVAGVLLTHGHPDHVWDAAEVSSWAGTAPAPVWIPGPDRYRLEDPMSLVQAPPEWLDTPWVKPTGVRDTPVGPTEFVPGVTLRMVPAPGHTEGSALFIGHCDLRVDLEGRTVLDAPAPVPFALSGDVLFAGSVGRTDLPGGDEVQMRHSLRTLANVIDPETLLLPGHGPSTTMARELASNPYLIRARALG